MKQIQVWNNGTYTQTGLQRHTSHQNTRTQEGTLRDKQIESSKWQKTAKKSIRLWEEKKRKIEREREWADRGETQMDERNVIDKVQ